MNSIPLEEKPINLLKITGLGTYSKKLSINKINYKLLLAENIVQLDSKETFLLCSLKQGNDKIHFCFPSHMINYFCYQILKIKLPQEHEHAHIYKHFYPIFADALVIYLNSSSSSTFELLDAKIETPKANHFLQLSLDSKNQKFQFFVHSDQKNLITSILKSMSFEKEAFSGKKLDASSLKTNFPVEIGVTYLEKEVLEAIEENDIILFDKKTDFEHDHMCINLNRAKYVLATLSHNELTILSEMKDW